ncbi:hypothetical protein ADUPG1_004393, partial [Aduncisulcus paluster]
LEESVKMTGYGIPGKDDDRRGPSYNTTGIMPRGKAPEDLRCWNCDGFGHYTDQCTEPLCPREVYEERRARSMKNKRGGVYCVMCHTTEGNNPVLEEILDVNPCDINQKDKDVIENLLISVENHETIREDESDARGEPPSLEAILMGPGTEEER